jgi:outer membrane murein-binding lipoprotein Lpp
MRVLTGLALLVVFGLAGCASSESSQLNKARIIANENRKLTQQIEQKDKRIAELEAQVEQLKADTEKKIQQLNESSNAVIDELITKHRELEAEIERLKGGASTEK